MHLHYPSCLLWIILLVSCQGLSGQHAGGVETKAGEKVTGRIFISGDSIRFEPENGSAYLLSPNNIERAYYLDPDSRRPNNAVIYRSIADSNQVNLFYREVRGTKGQILKSVNGESLVLVPNDGSPIFVPESSRARQALVEEMLREREAQLLGPMLFESRLSSAKKLLAVANSDRRYYPRMIIGVRTWLETYRPSTAVYENNIHWQYPDSGTRIIFHVPIEDATAKGRGVESSLSVPLSASGLSEVAITLGYLHRVVNGTEGGNYPATLRAEADYSSLGFSLQLYPFGGYDKRLMVGVGYRMDVVLRQRSWLMQYHLQPGGELTSRSWYPQAFSTTHILPRISAGYLIDWPKVGGIAIDGRFSFITGKGNNLAPFFEVGVGAIL